MINKKKSLRWFTVYIFFSNCGILERSDAICLDSVCHRAVHAEYIIIIKCSYHLTFIGDLSRIWHIFFIRNAISTSFFIFAFQLFTSSFMMTNRVAGIIIISLVFLWVFTAISYEFLVLSFLWSIWVLLLIANLSNKWGNEIVIIHVDLKLCSIILVVSVIV